MLVSGGFLDVTFPKFQNTQTLSQSFTHSEKELNCIRFTNRTYRVRGWDSYTEDKKK